MYDEMYGRVEILTPEIAKEYLLKNVDYNRSLIKSGIKQYSEDMTSGNWILTHQGIAFNTNGELIDGQNRLISLSQCESNVRVPMFVVYNCPVESFHVIDGGKKRSQSFRMKNLINEPQYYSNVGLSAAKFIMNIFYGINPSTVSIDTIKAFIDKHKGIHAYVYKTCANNKTTSSGAYGCGLLAALACGVDSQIIDEFNDCVQKGEISDNRTVNWKAANEFERWHHELPSLSGSGTMVIFYTVKSAIYKFANNIKGKSKREPYCPTSKELDELNIKLIEKYSRGEGKL